MLKPGGSGRPRKRVVRQFRGGMVSCSALNFREMAVLQPGNPLVISGWLRPPPPVAS